MDKPTASATPLAEGEGAKRKGKKRKEGWFLDDRGSPLPEDDDAHSRTRRWMQEMFEPGTTEDTQAVGKMHLEYLDAMQRLSVGALSKVAFGRLIRTVFPGITTSRIGPRGSNVPHYVSIRRRRRGPNAADVSSDGQFVTRPHAVQSVESSGRGRQTNPFAQHNSVTSWQIDNKPDKPMGTAPYDMDSAVLEDPTKPRKRGPPPKAKKSQLHTAAAHSAASSNGNKLVTFDWPSFEADRQRQPRSTVTNSFTNHNKHQRLAKEQIETLTHSYHQFSPATASLTSVSYLDPIIKIYRHDIWPSLPINPAVTKMEFLWPQLSENSSTSSASPEMFCSVTALALAYLRVGNIQSTIDCFTSARTTFYSLYPDSHSFYHSIDSRGYDIARSLFPVVYWMPHFSSDKAMLEADTRHFLGFILSACRQLGATTSDIYWCARLMSDALPHLKVAMTSFEEEETNAAGQWPEYLDSWMPDAELQGYISTVRQAYTVATVMRTEMTTLRDKLKPYVDRLLLPPASSSLVSIHPTSITTSTTTTASTVQDGTFGICEGLLEDPSEEDIEAVNAKADAMDDYIIHETSRGNLRRWIGATYPLVSLGGRLEIAIIQRRPTVIVRDLIERMFELLRRLEPYEVLVVTCSPGTCVDRLLPLVLLNEGMWEHYDLLLNLTSLSALVPSVKMLREGLIAMREERLLQLAFARAQVRASIVGLDARSFLLAASSSPPPIEDPTNSSGLCRISQLPSGPTAVTIKTNQHEGEGVEDEEEKEEEEEESSSASSLWEHPVWGGPSMGASSSSSSSASSASSSSWYSAPTLPPSVGQDADLLGHAWLTLESHDPSCNE